MKTYHMTHESILYKQKCREVVIALTFQVYGEIILTILSSLHRPTKVLHMWFKKKKYSTVKLKMETKYYSTLFPILYLEKKRNLTNNDVIPCSIFKMISYQKLHFMELQYRKNTKPHYLYGHDACYDKLTSRKSSEFLSARILRDF